MYHFLNFVLEVYVSETTILFPGFVGVKNFNSDKFKQQKICY